MARGTVIENEVNPKNGAEVVAASAPAIPPALNDDTRIVVKSLVPAVYYTCQTTFESFMWVEVGDEQEMTFRQLKIMKAKHPRYLTERWLLPCNDLVVKKLALKETFVNELNHQEMAVFYGNDIKEGESLIKKLSESGKEEIKAKIEGNVKNGKIANVKMIRMLENQLGLVLMQYV